MEDGRACKCAATQASVTFIRPVSWIFCFFFVLFHYQQVLSSCRHPTFFFLSINSSCAFGEIIRRGLFHYLPCSDPSTSHSFWASASINPSEYNIAVLTKTSSTSSSSPQNSGRTSEILLLDRDLDPPALLFRHSFSSFRITGSNIPGIASGD